jgi:DnaJ-class molecular chaperone
MGVDYYAVLDVSRDASLWEIKLAYRKLALRLHPHRKQYQQHPNPRPEGVFDLPLPDLNEKIYWELLNEAYDVLSDQLRREIYNNYGEEGLKRGVVVPNGYIPPYCYHHDHMRTYYEFFGSYSPYADLIDAATNPPPLYTVKEGRGVIHKDPNTVKVLHVTLEDVYKGGVKSFKYIRKEFTDELKNNLEEREVTIIVPITPGCLEGSRIIFNEAGDQSMTRKSGDFIFVTCDIPHEKYRRENANLHTDYTISLKEALTGFKMSIMTLDDRKLDILVTDIVE